MVSSFKYTWIFATLENAEGFYVTKLLIRFQGSFSCTLDSIFIAKYVEVNNVLVFFPSLRFIF